MTENIRLINQENVHIIEKAKAQKNRSLGIAGPKIVQEWKKWPRI